MREFLSWRFAKAAGSCTLAGSLALGLYLTSTPGRTIERNGQSQFGHARVVDGDTLEIAGRRIRLEGIDAPELGQRCPHRWWGTWAAGRKARRVLKRMVGSRIVTCTSRGYDKYGRMLASCRVGSLELNAEMVRRGMAWAFRRYSQSYVAAEEVAKLNRAGVWQSACLPAWAYRSARWQKGALQAPQGCAIKGNISKSGARLYHMPWSDWYAQTRIEPDKGERWFCDEREAIRAGWRPAMPLR